MPRSVRIYAMLLAVMTAPAFAQTTTSPWDDAPAAAPARGDARGYYLDEERTQVRPPSEPARGPAPRPLPPNNMETPEHLSNAPVPPVEDNATQRVSHGAAPIPLRPQSDASPSSLARQDMPPLATAAVSLGIVLGLFLLVAWVVRRGMPKSAAMLPKEAVQMLGRAPLVGRQHVHLVRCGNKILLLSVTPNSVETLTEITDPMEVDRLAGICQQSSPHSSSASFRQQLEQFNKRPRGVDYTLRHDENEYAGLDLRGATRAKESHV